MTEKKVSMALKQQRQQTQKNHAAIFANSTGLEFNSPSSKKVVKGFG